MLDAIRSRHLDFHDTCCPMRAMEVDYPNGSSTGLHSHPRAQLLHAIAGVMIVRSTAGTWVVPPNRAVWLTAGLDHEVTMRGDVKIRTVFVDADASPHLPRGNYVMAVTPLLRELIVAATRIGIDYAPGSRDEHLIQLLMDELRTLDVLPLHLPMPGDTRLRAICESLLREPHDDTTAEKWADGCGIASKTLHRLFSKETGLSFAQWRQQARLLSALERLAQGERIIDVAINSGYASQSAFTAMFKKHFGMTPSAFYK